MHCIKLIPVICLLVRLLWHNFQWMCRDIFIFEHLKLLITKYVNFYWLISHEICHILRKFRNFRHRQRQTCMISMYERSPNFCRGELNEPFPYWFVRTVCSSFRYKQQTEFIPYNGREITTGENWKESPDVVILWLFKTINNSDKKSIKEEL